MNAASDGEDTSKAMLSDTIKRQFFFLKYRLYRKQDIVAFQSLLKTQFLSSDELEEINWCKRRALVTYAFEKVPYYRKNTRPSACIRRTSETAMTSSSSQS